jgi:hypothetical protein
VVAAVAAANPSARIKSRLDTLLPP